MVGSPVTYGRSFLERMRSLFAAPADPHAAERLQEEQLAAVWRNTPGMMAANLCNALVLLAALWDTPMAGAATLWASALIAVVGYIYLRARRRARKRLTTSRLSRVSRRAVFNALLLGALWAAVPALFFIDADSGGRLMVVSLTAGMLFGGAFALATAPLAALAFISPIVIASEATFLRGGDPDHMRIAIVLAIYVAVLLRTVFVDAENLRKRVLTHMDAEQQARTDALTGLPNRLGFTDAIEREFARMSRTGAGFLLLCVDLDNFKTINDRLGHPAGDELLVAAAERMRACLRGYDVVARLGGDEFAIIANGVDGRENAVALAERIILCFDESFLIEGREIYGAASVGGALAPINGADQRELVKSADIALYQAKQRGGCWRLFESNHDMESRESRALELDLRRTISLRQLALVFQPIINVATGRIVGCEALLRWNHPTRGQVAPSLFIPLAEKTGFIDEIGLWVIEEACAAAAHFPPDFRVAINISPLQLRRQEFPDCVFEALTRTQAEPSRIEIEITETALLADDEVSDAAIRKLSGAGLSISLDDFGAGYSSLNYLRKLPLHRVKIDRSFVGDVLTKKDCAAIVTGVTRMAADLDMRIVAEGVETLAQLQWLRNVGCSEAQGYLISRPLPRQEFLAFLAAWRPDRLEPASAAGGMLP